ncbi:MAG: hypothetical protein FWD30_02310, partial [Dehalococcoidia bacterium]|nr:hypothetical protein [Dehalococcoidia bacterium]
MKTPKHKKKFLLGILLSMCMTLATVLTFSSSTQAADIPVAITESMSAADIQSNIQTAINNASSGDTVTVTGAKTNETADITLTIPAGITLTWKALSQDLSFNIDGGGTFDVAGGEISTSGTYSVAIYVGSDAVNVSDGKVTASGIYCSAIEVGSGSVTVSGGEVTADGDGQHGCYAIYLYNPGTVTVTGGKVSAVNAIGNMFAITLGGGGLAAYLEGTCEGDFMVLGNGIIVESELLIIPDPYGGTTTGLTRISRSAISNVKWDTSKSPPVINFSNGAFTIEWAEPTPPTSVIGDSVRRQDNGDLFGTLAEAIASAGADGLSVFTIEVIGEATESGNISITSDVTIVGANGAHTVTLANSISVRGGGKLTLGDSTGTNLLTLIGYVSVTDGAIDARDGIILQTSRSYALEMIGPNATGVISGGRFTGKNDAVHLSDTGTKIDKISGGVFYQVDTSVALHGHAIFVQNNSQIGEISGSYFEAALNSALSIIRGGHVGEISGGDFVTLRMGTTSPDTRNATIHIEGETSIGTISGGHFRGGYFGVLVIIRNAQAQIDLITGGLFEGTIGLQNDIGCIVDEISGGEFSGTNYGIMNAGTINLITGDAEIYGNSAGIWNYNYGLIKEISGSTISSGDSGAGISNAGTIQEISGGTIIGGFNAISCTGSNRGRLNVVSGGVFWAKSS